MKNLCSGTHHGGISILNRKMKAFYMLVEGLKHCCTYIVFDLWFNQKKSKSQLYYFGEFALLNSTIYELYYFEDRTKWICTKRGPPVSTTEPSNVNQHPLPVTVSLWSLSYPMQPSLPAPIRFPCTVYTVQLCQLTQFLHNTMFFRNQNVHYISGD